MPDDIFNRLRREERPTSSSPYSFQGGGTSQQHSPQNHFGARPGQGNAAGPTIVRPNANQQNNDPVRPAYRPERDANGDRPMAYQPPAVRREEEGDMYKWEPPGFGDILADLGLRLLEVGIASAAYAIGEEIAYFFRKRRFTGNSSVRYTRD